MGPLTGGAVQGGLTWRGAGSAQMRPGARRRSGRTWPRSATTWWRRTGGGGRSFGTSAARSWPSRMPGWGSTSASRRPALDRTPSSVQHVARMQRGLAAVYQAAANNERLWCPNAASETLVRVPPAHHPVRPAAARQCRSPDEYLSTALVLEFSQGLESPRLSRSRSSFLAHGLSEAREAALSALGQVIVDGRSHCSGAMVIPS